MVKVVVRVYLTSHCEVSVAFLHGWEREAIVVTWPRGSEEGGGGGRTVDGCLCFSCIVSYYCPLVMCSYVVQTIAAVSVCVKSKDSYFAVDRMKTPGGCYLSWPGWSETWQLSDGLRPKLSQQLDIVISIVSNGNVVWFISQTHSSGRGQTHIQAHTHTLYKKPSLSLRVQPRSTWIINALCCFGIWGVSWELWSNEESTLKRQRANPESLKKWPTWVPKQIAHPSLFFLCFLRNNISKKMSTLGWTLTIPLLLPCPPLLPLLWLLPTPDLCFWSAVSPGVTGLAAYSWKWTAILLRELFASRSGGERRKPWQ